MEIIIFCGKVLLVLFIFYLFGKFIFDIFIFRASSESLESTDEFLEIQHEFNEHMDMCPTCRQNQVENCSVAREFISKEKRAFAKFKKRHPYLTGRWENK